MLDTFVLAIISRQDTYGYLISQEIKKVIDLKESTLYPVLRRLQEAG
ncbi:MAG: helix-turn-helix transcriptional regulator, partial [Hungatella sp.]